MAEDIKEFSKYMEQMQGLYPTDYEWNINREIIWKRLQGISGEAKGNDYKNTTSQ